MMEADILFRYAEKIKQHCCGIDPYKLATSEDPLPRNVHYYDICNYCIEKSSSYTHEAFRAYKTLEAYKLYESGWIQWITCKTINTGSIIVAKVKHSYRINLTPLKCWVAIDKTGIVLTGHCECMAGLGEVCSHIGAVFFLLEDWGRLTGRIETPVSTPKFGELICVDNCYIVVGINPIGHAGKN